MNTQFHAPSFGDEVFDLEDNNTISTTNSANSSSMSTGNVVTNNIGNASYMYQQQSSTPQQTSQTKRMINLHNTSDEYHTANEDSFTTTNAVTVGGSNQQGAVGTPTIPTPTLAARKQMSPADPNEPAKPLSAYALFFRDTVSAIKQQNPTCSFPELSKIVASMWDALDPIHKSVYNKKNELARNEYIKQMRAYRLQQEQQQTTQNSGEGQQPALANNTNTPNSAKPNVFTMNTNQQQQGQTASPSPQVPNTNTSHATASTPTASEAVSSAPAGDQIQLLSEASSVQKCTRDGCPKRAIINPDWEDEYCSNECVVVHCRNVFNEWVKSNLEGKQQPQTELQQQSQATT